MFPPGGKQRVYEKQIARGGTRTKVEVKAEVQD